MTIPKTVVSASTTSKAMESFFRKLNSDQRGGASSDLGWAQRENVSKRPMPAMLSAHG